jgi:hypothetical protein
MPHPREHNGHGEQTRTAPLDRGALLADGGRYRYWLTRRWAPGSPATFVMLNPSTADDQADDPTIRRCIGFARRWGYGALHVVNLYALRATHPTALAGAVDPVGPDNDHWLTTAATNARLTNTLLIAAWGAHPRTPRRVAHVLALPGMQRLHALGRTRTGAPRHPLYLPTTANPTPWPPGSPHDPQCQTCTGDRP